MKLIFLSSILVGLLAINKTQAFAVANNTTADIENLMADHHHEDHDHADHHPDDEGHTCAVFGNS